MTCMFWKGVSLDEETKDFSMLSHVGVKRLKHGKEDSFCERHDLNWTFEQKKNIVCFRITDRYLFSGHL